jgi:hypothetical protein
MRGSGIQIWFFIGVLLLIYGVLILSYGVYEAVIGPLAPVELNYLHTPIWWGGLMGVLGVFYTIKFRPGRVRK